MRMAPVAPEAQSGGSGYIVETARFQFEIVGAVRSADVVVVGPAVESEVAAWRSPRSYPN